MLPARATPGAAPANAAEIVIDLFDGASVTAVFDRFDQNSSGVTWVGHVPGRPGSLVTLVQGGGLLAGSINLPDASYTIRPLSRDASDPASGTDPLHALFEVDDDAFMPEAPPVVPEISPQALAAAAADVKIAADSGEIIDLLVVYTSLAESWATSQAGIINWINLNVSETNSSYAAGGVSQRVRLVHTERVNYQDVNELGTSLNVLRAGGVGLEGVAALRNAYTADLVALFVRPVTANLCGIAFLMTFPSTAFATSGFSVTDARCGGATFAHELGHNMGLRHDWYMDAGVTPFTYAHGYVNLEGRFRTIMSYPDSCTSRGVTCTRILAFSNPELTFQGLPMGIAGGTNATCPTTNALNMSCDADERRALNNTAFSVANFREFSTLRPPLIVSHPQSQSAAAGQPITLQVAAEGLGPFTYQWYRGAAPTVTQPIPGATGPVLTTVPGADGIWLERWSYWARVSNGIGPANSNTATISLVRPGAEADAAGRRTAARDVVGVPGRSAAGTAVPRTGAVAPAAAWWAPFEIGAADPLACRDARLAARLAWTALSRRPDDVVEMTDALEQLVTAIAALQEPACRASGGQP